MRGGLERVVKEGHSVATLVLGVSAVAKDGSRQCQHENRGQDGEADDEGCEWEWVSWSVTDVKTIMEVTFAWVGTTVSEGVAVHLVGSIATVHLVIAYLAKW